MNGVASPTPGTRRLRESAVLVPVYRDEAGDLRLVLIRRAGGGIHGGQLAFPGGKRDPEDPSFLATALRESEEEIGLRPEAATVLGELPTVETRTTGFRIYSFLARIARPPAWRLAEAEVAEVLEVSVEELLRPETHATVVESIPAWSKPTEIPFYRVGPHRLWGVTYRITRPLLPRLRAGEWVV